MFHFLDRLPILALFFLTVLLALAGVEAGRWLAGRVKARGTEPEGPVGASVGATLGLLAFILALTFSMAASRFDARKQMVIQDANAIGTTYLRASLLPEPVASQSRADLRKYVDVRLGTVADSEALSAVITSSEQLQSELWKRATAIANAQPTLTTTPLFVQALNEMIDVHGMRVAAVRSRIPVAIWGSLLLTTALGMMAMGYQVGLSGSRRSPAVVCLAIAFAGVIMLIVDLDRPQEGFLRVNQQSMLDLQESMRRDAAAESAP